MEKREVLSGTYTLMEKIGRGSGGTVYKAYHNRLHKLVVMKKLNEPGRSVIKNRQEVDILKNLRHTYLPQVLDFFENEEGIFTVMSFIPGRSFYDLLKEGETFSRDDLLKWAMQICSALNYLHTQTIPVIHGDIKPANIMLTPDGDICLIDFNISFYLDENTVLGYTDGYTSPEQYMAVTSKRKRGTSKFVIDQKADIYSVGATLYHLATGAKRVGYDKSIDMAKLINAVGADFAEVIARAAELDREKRYDSIYDMFEALAEIPGKEEGFRKRRRQKKWKHIGIAAAAVAAVGLALGIAMMMKEKKYDRYDGLVDHQIEAMDAGDFTEAEKLFYEAKELIPSEPEAYYQQAYALYLQGNYEESIEFIENEIVNNDDLNREGRRMMDVYTLEGLDYIELEDGAAAVKCFEAAHTMGKFDGADYRDHAIALAYDGQLEQAEEMLDKAEEAGLDEAALAYTRGELHYAKGEDPEALNEFLRCIETTEDPYMCMRAYLMANKLYRLQGDLQSSRALLTEAVGRLPVQQQPVILEAIVQTDIDLAETSGSDACREEAVTYLEKIISNGWAGYGDYDTLAILLMKQGDLSGVSDTLSAMQDLYGDDYNIYKRLAFLEIGIQEIQPQEERDYGEFVYYYEKANTLYEAEVKGNRDDAEMSLLEDVYRQLVTGGWL